MKSDSFWLVILSEVKNVKSKMTPPDWSHFWHINTRLIFGSFSPPPPFTPDPKISLIHISTSFHSILTHRGHWPRHLKIRCFNSIPIGTLNGIWKWHIGPPLTLSHSYIKNSNQWLILPLTSLKGLWSRDKGVKYWIFFLLQSPLRLAEDINGHWFRSL